MSFHKNLSHYFTMAVLWLLRTRVYPKVTGLSP